MKIFAERLKKLRTENNLSQSELAELLNIHKNMVADWEKGKKLPKLKNIILLKKQFNVSVDYLLGLKD